ncbi:MAG: phenylalanine--tRNA ligase subunit beta [Anaerolineae bacterium]|jgi:phenylalanyl-tRNA synthetase beta chain|nr:phenylalanine--tRNA ligase subunit beta [Anaerolineae bacterium]MBT7325353.1 phenylalanine--tRNA ligase subunit beta [Anaerolineae bacterium]
MKLPVSWLKDYVNINISVEELARLLTLAGLEVEEIRYVGWAMPDYAAGEKHEFKTYGLSWDPDKLVVAEIREVKPHPDADRLVLCDLFDGKDQHLALTGAPNLLHLKTLGPLETPIKVAYAKEGAEIYDGHKDGQVLTKLKRAKIRGIESYSMVCSEKELGISDEHEGIILLDDDAPVGMPLADYMGDAVFSIDILPNNARNVNVLGIAREVAALTNQPLKRIDKKPYETSGDAIADNVKIEIAKPELNARFVLGLIRDVEIAPSPYLVQRRLRLVGIRPINNLVDATNYAMFEVGEPLHAFDYDVLVERAKGKEIVISTRTADEGEKLTTLDVEERTLQASNVLVCDEAGALSIAGVMGGLESEVTESTKNVLLEGAAWNFINIRRTANHHNLPSEASYRFSRGVHPALAEDGVKRGLYWMQKWANGKVAPDLVDNYPLPPADPVVTVTEADVKRLLGVEISAEKIAGLLTRLEFDCQVQGTSVTAATPSIRMDIGEGIVGKADVIEEIARLYGYDNIPETRIGDPLPPQIGNPVHDWEEKLRDQLATLGLQETVNYRMTSADAQERLGSQGEFVKLANPSTPEKAVLRRSLMASVLEVVEKNARLRDSLAFFEIGPVFVPNKGDLPDEPRKLAIAMTGGRQLPAWDTSDAPEMDFYDLKGVTHAFLAGLGLKDIVYTPADTSTQPGAAFHPGKSAQVTVNGKVVGAFGELHPISAEKYEFADTPVLAAEFDLETLRGVQPAYEITPVPAFPPMLEDIALIVDEALPAAKVEHLIRQTGGKMLADARLFDVYRDEKLGEGKKSLAYALTYQAPDRTLTDKEAAKIRKKIVKRLEYEVGAELRG